METKPKSYVQAAFEVANTEGNMELYKKFRKVDARPAIEGEVVVTMIDGEEETKNTAKKGDMVVRTKKNGALYIISGDKFHKRYKDGHGEQDEYGYVEYTPIGETYAFEYHGESFKFIAPWGEEMLVNDGDYICAPEADNLDDIYRIERGEFKDTYEVVETKNSGILGD